MVWLKDEERLFHSSLQSVFDSKKKNKKNHDNKKGLTHTEQQYLEGI